MTPELNIIFDFGNLFHRSYFATDRNLTGINLENDQHCAILVRKVFTDLCAAVRRFSERKYKDIYAELHNTAVLNEVMYELNDVVICFDSNSEKIFRKDIYKDYKANRTKKEQKFYDVIEECYNALINKKLNAFRIEGLEADDLVAIVSADYYESRFLNVIVSADEDVRQLAKSNTVIYNNTSAKKILFYEQRGYDGKDDQDFYLFNDSMYNFIRSLEIKSKDNDIELELVSPFNTLLSKIFLGCDGDNVPRILPRGMGISKLTKVFKKLGYEQFSTNSFDTLSEIVEQTANELDVKVDGELIFQQIVLVWLSHQCYPADLNMQAYKWFQLRKRLPHNFEWKMQNLLSETKYIHY